MTRPTTPLWKVVSYIVAAQSPVRPSPPRIVYQLCIADSISMRRLGHQITECQWVSSLWGPHAGAADDPFAPDPNLDAIIATATRPQAAKRALRAMVKPQEAAILDEVVEATRLMPFVSLVVKASADCDRTDIASS